MSHATVVLHEKFEHEHIPDSDHEVVHQEMAAIGFTRTAPHDDGVVRHLPRACYFSAAGTKEDVARVYHNLKSRLGREVSIEVTIGTSAGYGLKPVVQAPVSSFLTSLISPPPAVFKLGGIPVSGDSWEKNLFGSLGGVGKKLK